MPTQEYDQRVDKVARLIYLSKIIGCIVILLGIEGCNLASQSNENYRLQDNTLPLGLVWQFTAPENLVDPAIVSNDTTVYLRTQTEMYALDPFSGRIQWQREIASSADLAPVADQQYVYVPLAWRFELEALDAATGQTQWLFDPGQYTSAHAGRPQITSIITDEEGLYVVVNLRRGTDVFLLDPNTGQILAQAPKALSQGQSAPGAFFVNSSWVFVEEYGSWLLSKNLGQIIDRVPNEIDSYRPPTFAAKTAYTSGQVVKAIKLPSFQIKWQFEDKCVLPWDLVPVSPLVADQSIYVTTTCNSLYKLNTENGNILWEYKSPTTIHSFVIIGDFGYFVSSDASIQAIDLSTGTLAGALEIKPLALAQASYQYLTASDDLLVVTYGNNQAFAFQAK